MKRTALVALASLAAIVVFLLVRSASSRPDAPGFTQVAIPLSPAGVSYDFLGRRQFEHGRMWITVASGPTNQDIFLYDLGRHQVLDEITNACPELLFGDPPRLLCYQPASFSRWDRTKADLALLVTRLTAHRLTIDPPSDPGCDYWVLDPARRSATPLGTLPGSRPSPAVPSPDFTRCFVTRHLKHGSGRYLLNLQACTIEELPSTLAGCWLCDWWDNDRILLRKANHNVALYDVRTRSLAEIVSLEAIATFLHTNGVSADLRYIYPFAIWNGGGNDFYLQDAAQRWLARDSFLIKLERPDARQKLIYPNFKFEWSDHLDPALRHYLYSGRESGKASDGVFVRDLDSGRNRTLVAPTTNQYFSIPGLRGDSAIYLRSNALWQIGLDGSNNVKLFPCEARADTAKTGS